jgi:hypothetical protein
MESILRTFAERGDLAHLALFLWASGVSALLWRALKELVAANRRFDDFVRELARFNAWFAANRNPSSQAHSTRPGTSSRMRRTAERADPE